MDFRVPKLGQSQYYRKPKYTPLMQVHQSMVQKHWPGYGQVDDRPSGVDESWVVRTERIPGVSDDYDVLAERVSALEERLVTEGYYPHGYRIPENEDGTYGPAEVSYWGPPVSAKPEPWAIVLGVGASALSLIGIGISILNSE